MWNRKEALFLSSVSQYLGLSIVFTSDLEYFAPLSSVGCIGTLMVSVGSGRTRLPSNLLRLLGSSSGASRSLPLACQYSSGNNESRRLLHHSDNDNLWILGAFGLWVLCAGIVKDSFVVLRRLILMFPVPERFPGGQQPYSEPRRARWWIRTRESVARAHPVTSRCNVFLLLSRHRCLDSFHPRVLIVRTAALE